MEPLDEIKARILELENKKKEIEDLIPWHQNEMPKFAKELEALKEDLHALRAELKAAKEVKPTDVSADKKDDDEGAFLGFFGK